MATKGNWRIWTSPVFKSSSGCYLYLLLHKLWSLKLFECILTMSWCSTLIFAFLFGEDLCKKQSLNNSFWSGGCRVSKSLALREAVGFVVFTFFIFSWLKIFDTARVYQMMKESSRVPLQGQMANIENNQIMILVLFWNFLDKMYCL